MISFVVGIATIGIVPLGLYLVARLNPAIASAMGRHPGIVIAVAIVSASILSWAFHEVVVVPCHAKTKLHTVTDNLGNFYSTEYEDSGDWCLWVRGEF